MTIIIAKVLLVASGLLWGVARLLPEPYETPYVLALCVAYGTTAALLKSKRN